MKKLKLCIAAAAMLVTIFPTQMKAETKTLPTYITDSKTYESAEVSVILARLDIIKTMDRSKMNADQKKHIRLEVRSAKIQLKGLRLYTPTAFVPRHRFPANH